MRVSHSLFPSFVWSFHTTVALEGMARSHLLTGIWLNGTIISRKANTGNMPLQPDIFGFLWLSRDEFSSPVTRCVSKMKRCTWCWGWGCSGGRDSMWPPQKELQSLFVQLSRVRVLRCHHEGWNSILCIKEVLRELKCKVYFWKKCWQQSEMGRWASGCFGTGKDPGVGGFPRDTS